MVSNDYQLPSIFVRHTRKVGDEADLLVDYVMEDDDALWMKTNPKIVNDKELSKALTVEVFEYLINLYEKHTGFGVDCLPLVSIRMRAVLS